MRLVLSICSLTWQRSTRLGFADMRIADLIYKKAQREELNDDEVRFFINELVTDGVEDSQLGTIWLRALFWHHYAPALYLVVNIIGFSFHYRLQSLDFVFQLFNGEDCLGSIEK